MTKRKSASIIDKDILHTVFGDNQAAMCQYLEDFIQRTSTDLQQIRTAIDTKDQSFLLEIFHRLKGPAGTSGFMKIYTLCEKAEDEVAESNWIAAKKVCAEIDKQLKKIQIALQKELRNS